jgi:2,4-diketo-3-deoxy-L-fuconate hydrolase
MKLVRYGKPGKEKPGLIDSDGRLRDLSAVVADIGPDQLSDAALARLRKLKSDTLPLVKGSPRMGCPVAGIGKFIAIGLNYADHAAEAGMPIPAEPIVFMKATSCIQGPDDPVMLPKGSKKSDWEVELGVVIGGRPAMCRKRMGCRMWPATAWSTTSANEPSRSSAAAPGTREKAATRSAPSAPGW